MKKLLLLTVALAATLPMTASARGHVGVFVGPGFAPYGWYRPYAFYGPPWYGPYAFGPYYSWSPRFGTPNAGQVKLDTKVKDAQVFINGNYAGTVGELKTMKMRAGDYSIEVREPGHEPFREKIHVLAGKTIKLHPDLPAEYAPDGSHS